MSIDIALGHTPAIDVPGPVVNDIECWSVTTIIDVLEKKGIPYWTAEQTALAAIHKERTWKAMLAEEGEEAAVKWLRDARLRRPKDRLSDTAFGTEIHNLCEQFALTGTKPTPTADVFLKDLPEARACIDQFARWLDRFTPGYLATEMTVFTPDYRIAGTSDGIMIPQRGRLAGMRGIFDYKSSKKSVDSMGKPTSVYPEIGMQLAAYRWATFAAIWRARRYHDRWQRRFYLLSAEEVASAVPVPKVDVGIGIKITPEHCTAYEIRCGEEIYEYFLHTMELARWNFEVARTVIGAPLDEEIG